MKRVKWFLLVVLLVVVTGCMSEVSEKTEKKESGGEVSQSIMEKNIAKIIEEMKKITSESGNGNVGVGIYVTGSNGDVKFYSRDYLSSESTTAGVISMVAKEMSAANNKTNDVNCIVLEGNKAYTVNDIVSTSVDNITAKDAKQIVQPNKKVVDVKTNLSKRPEDRIIEVKYLSCENGLLTVALREEDKNENEFIKYFSNANRDIQVYDENGTKVQSLKINSFKKKNDASKLYDMDIEKIYNVNEDRIVSYGKVFRISAVYINNEEFGDIYILKGEQIKIPKLSISLSKTEINIKKGETVRIDKKWSENLLAPGKGSFVKHEKHFFETYVKVLDNLDCYEVTGISSGRSTLNWDVHLFNFNKNSYEINPLLSASLVINVIEEPKFVSVQSVSLSEENTSIELGKELKLESKILPDNATNKTVTWFSSNQTVATVDENGSVKALAEGIAVISVKTKDENLIKNCIVKVFKITHVTELKFDKPEIEIIEGNIGKLVCTILPADASIKSLNWSSSNMDIVLVDDNGSIEAFREGTAVITAMTNDNNKIATCLVRVKGKIPVKSISFDRTSLKLYMNSAGSMGIMPVRIQPVNATNKNVKWSSSNSKVATVKDGVFGLISVGKTEITATTEDGNYTAKLVLEVIDTTPTTIPVKSISFNRTSLTLDMNSAGSMGIMPVRFQPVNATNKNVKWSSSNSKVATVKDGVFGLISVGTTEITATTEDGNYTAKLILEVINTKLVKIPVTGVRLSQTNLTLDLKDMKNFGLIPIIQPENATNKNVKWSSSNPTVAIVKDGSVDLLSVGTTEITTTTEDGNYTGKLILTVINTKPVIVPVTGVSLAKTNLTLELKESNNFGLLPIIQPENATNKKVTWSSSNPSVAIVKDGNVSLLSVGTTEIIVKTEDGNCTAKLILNVISIKPVTIPVTGVSLAKTNLTVELKDSNDFGLLPIIQPENATNKNVKWSSSNPAVASVKDGNVHLLSAGTTEIIVTTEDGKYTAKCVLLVNAPVIPVTGVNLIKISHIMLEGDRFDLLSTVLPLNATNKGVKWTTSNSDVVVVDSNGKITSKSAGEAIITVKTDDGGYIAKATVMVIAAPVSVTGIRFEQSEITITEKNIVQLTPVILPLNAANKGIKWSTSNPNAVTVDNNGKITGIAAGGAIITAKTEDGGYKAECYVTVKVAIVSATGITLKDSKITLIEGKTTTLTAEVLPINANNKGLVWSSSNSDVAIVDTNGIVKGVSPGTAVIRVSTLDGNFRAECNVTITPLIISVTGVKLNQSNIGIVRGDSIKLVATVLPINASNKEVIWSSSNVNAATVDNLGNVKGISDGSTVITVNSIDGNFKAECTVSVIKAPIYVTGVNLYTPILTMTKGNQQYIAYTILPEDSSNKTVKWSSSDSNIVSVESDGKVSAVSVGSAVITLKTEDGNFESKCTVAVKEGNVDVNGVKFDSNELSIYAGREIGLGYSVLPLNATNRNVTLESSNPSIATVIYGNTIKGVSPGNTFITIRTEEGGYTAVCAVTVKLVSIDVTSVTLDISRDTLMVGSEEKLNPLVLPQNATNKGLTWNSSNMSVMEVDNNGNIKAKTVGSAVITVTTSDGGFTDSCSVTVIAKPVAVTGVTFEPESVTLNEDEVSNLMFRVLPSDATNMGVSFSSSDVTVATVDSVGRLTGKKAGNTQITVITADGNYTAKCNVTVEAAVISGYNNGIVINGSPYSQVTIAAGFAEAVRLAVTALSADANITGIKWSSKDTNIAIVDSNGRVQGTYTTGVTKIVAETADGRYKAECEVTVKPIKVISIWAHPNNITLTMGTSYQGVTIDFTPANATNKRVTYNSLDSNIATVDSYGKITAKGLGKVDIIIKSEDGGYESAVTVTVIN